MTKHIQSPRENFYAESVCGDPPILTGGTWAPQVADCARCIALYEQEHGPIARPTREENPDPYACPLCGETTAMGPHRPDCPEVLNGTAHPDAMPASEESPK